VWKPNGRGIILMSKRCYWGAFPWERDGGAVVNYYLLKKQHELRPQDVYYGVPKVPEELEPQYLPFINFPIVETDWENSISGLMHTHKIPLVNLFHIGVEEFEKVIDPVHAIGGRLVLHQTIHWADDAVMQSRRLNDFDSIVAPTEYAKKVFVQLGHVSSRKVSVIPHAVDTKRFYRHKSPLRERLGIKPHQKVVFYSGRLGLWKGVQELIPIMRELYQAYDCVFIIRGGAFGSDESRKLAKIFARLSYNNPNIIFISDWQSPEFMEELYGFVDILIFNSGHEGFGVPLIEAMAVEAVPITTALPNHVWICGNTGDTAILLDPIKEVGTVNKGTKIKVATHEALRGAIQWVLENPDEAAVMGRHGVNVVKKRFDLTKVCKQWLQLYDTLVPRNYNMDKKLLESLE